MQTQNPQKLLPALLALLDEKVNAVSAGMLAADPVHLEHACAEMRDISVEFTNWLQAQSLELRKDPMLVAHAKRLRNVLADQRAGLTRQAGSVQRALNSIVPATRETTYGGSRNTYSSSVKQTGVLGRLAA